MGTQPCRLCCQHVAQRYHSLLQAIVGVSQVLVGLLPALVRSHQPLFGFLDPLPALTYLQADLLAHVLHAQALDVGLRLGGTHLVEPVTPCQDGDIDAHSYGPHALELVPEAVKQRRIGGRIASGQHDLGQELAAHYPDFLGIYVAGQGQLLHFVPLRQGYVRIGYRPRLQAEVVTVLVSQGKVGRLQSALLCQEHLQQRDSVVCLNEGQLRLVDPDLHAETIGLGRKAFADHHLHIPVQPLHQLQIALCQLALARQLHYLPVCLVHRHYHVLLLLVVAVPGHLLGELGNLVIGPYLAAHIQRLREHGTQHSYVPRVRTQCFGHAVSQLAGG